MAITLNDLKERLEEVDLDIANLNIGNAHTRLMNIIGIIERSGVIIHAVAVVESKKVESNDSQEN